MIETQEEFNAAVARGGSEAMKVEDLRRILASDDSIDALSNRIARLEAVAEAAKDFAQGRKGNDLHTLDNALRELEQAIKALDGKEAP
jgi:hypothetical protein